MSDNPLILQYSDGNLVPYQVPDPEQATQRALDFTGIPDLAAGTNALARGEWLPGLGQAASGASAMLPLGKLAGAAKLGAELMPLGGLIKAWHGTPYLFEPVEHNPFGEFRDAAIGTGEGAQAYGHGHYVAGNPAVAGEYQRNLAGSNNYSVKIGDTEYNPRWNQPSSADFIDRLDQHLRDQNPEFKQAAPSSQGSFSTGVWNATEDWLRGKLDTSLRSQFPLNNSGYALAANHLQQHGKIEQPGSLLEVHILPDEHELLDWDKPLAEQPEGVRKVIDGIHAENEDLRIKHSGPGITGENFYRNLANQLWDKTLAGIGGGSKAASAALHEAGIPGIKYLDQWSRASGSGTSNYVIFDPKNLRIVGRNGQRLEPVEEDPFK